MSFLGYFFAGVFVILSVVCNGISYDPTSVEATPCGSSSCVVPASSWSGTPQFEEVEGNLFTLQAHHSKDWHFLRLIAAEMASSSSSGWLCGNCRKMRSPNAWFCDLCGGKWDDCAIEPASARVQTTWNQRSKSPKQRTRQKSRKKQSTWQSDPVMAQELHPQ